MARSPGPLLRLVHSLERRRPGLPFAGRLRLARLTPDGSVPDAGAFQTLELDDTQPRVLVIGAGDRVDLSVAATLLPRHLAVILVPRPDGVEIRVLGLHPGRTMEFAGRTCGGVLARDDVTVHFDGFVLETDAHIIRTGPPPTPIPAETFPVGEQLAFFAGAQVRPVGNVVASVGGPGGGGHAIPALVADFSSTEAAGSLVLRSRDGIHRLEPAPTELGRGLLIGRSRRCVLGRGFDENDGLSRLHALVLMLHDGVYAFDLASRYGLRDVARPSRVVLSSRLDNGIGCLVYGAGHLMFEA